MSDDWEWDFYFKRLRLFLVMPKLTFAPRQLAKHQIIEKRGCGSCPKPPKDKKGSRKHLFKPSKNKK